MAGETNLTNLLASMRPELMPGIFVFATVSAGAFLPAELEPVMRLVEAERVTLILAEEAARRAGLNGSFRCRMITLQVFSSLEAVGFMAAITTRLAAAGIGVNPVSGFHHDHLFVPADRADQAMILLEELATAGATSR